MKALMVNDTDFKLDEKELQENLKKISDYLISKGIITAETTAKEVTLVFLGKLPAKKLNWQYRQKDYPTDILSFESVSPESLGELVFCPEVLETQAKDHNQTFKQELNLMLLHGVLHLLGFDHEEGGEEEKKMMSLQEEAYAQLFKTIAKMPKAKGKKVGEAKSLAPKAKATKKAKKVSTKKSPSRAAKKAK